MNLKEFIEKYVCKNTLVRLWYPNEQTGHGHCMIHDGDKETCMEWEILKGKVHQSKYLNNKVVGVTDILCDSCKESVNIVIEI